MKARKLSLSEADQHKLKSGDLSFLVTTLTHFAKSWIEISGYPAQVWPSVSYTDIGANKANAPTSTTPEQRAFLAAGCDLLGLLALTPQGREAISQLIGQPFFQEAKRE